MNLRIAIALLTVFNATAQARIWTAKDGRTMEAQIVSADLDSVQVIMDNGAFFDIPFASLSASDVDFASNYVPPTSLEVPHIQEAVYTIKIGRSSGTGFLAQVNGLAYLYTNQHVIAGADRSDIVAMNTTGNRLAIGPLEIDPQSDVARILVPKREGLRFAKVAELDDEIICYGNSEGEGVVTRNKGTILGLGGEKVEVSAEIVPGNSGGPIVDRFNEVVGIATYLKRGFDEDEDKDDDEDEQDDKESDWTRKGTRYAKTRRFGLNMMSERTYMPIDWNTYTRLSRACEEDEEAVRIWSKLTVDILYQPLGTWNARNYPDRDSIRNTINVQNRESEVRKKFSGDTITASRLTSINRSIQETLQRQFDTSARQLMRELEDTRRDIKRYNLVYYVERNQELSDFVDYWRENLVRSAGSKAVFSFR